MKLVINGEDRDFDVSLSIHEILQKLDIEEKVMACAVNMEIVKQDQWGSFAPKEGDKIEFLQFVGGG